MGLAQGEAISRSGQERSAELTLKKDRKQHLPAQQLLRLTTEAKKALAEAVVHTGPFAHHH